MIFTYYKKYTETFLTLILSKDEEFNNSIYKYIKKNKIIIKQMNINIYFTIENYNNKDLLHKHHNINNKIFHFALFKGDFEFEEANLYDIKSLFKFMSDLNVILFPSKIFIIDVTKNR